jgi:hypothetical protein
VVKGISNSKFSLDRFVFRTASRKDLTFVLSMSRSPYPMEAALDIELGKA